MIAKVRLFRQEDSLMAVWDGQADEEAVPVRLVYARPISARDREIAVMDGKGKKELAWLESLDELDPISRGYAEDVLWQQYRIAKISKVTESHVNHGHRYLKVETDRGPRYFNLREPGSNVTHLTPDHLVIRDSMGNRYEVESVAALDEESQFNLERVL